MTTTHDRLVEICRDYIVDQAEHLVDLARSNKIVPKDAEAAWTEYVYYWAAEFLADTEGQELTRALAPEAWEAVRDATDAWQAEAMRPGGLLAELREQLHQAASGYSAADYLEAIDTGDPAAVARHIYQAVEGARHPRVYYPDSATAPVVHAVHTDVALVVIGVDPGDRDRIAWALYPSIDHYRENDPVERGGWHYDDRDTARREIAVIIDTLTRLGAEG